MDLSSLKKSPGARKARKRIGRGPGSGTGKTSGKGHKGQMSRSGAKHRAGFEGGQMPLHRRLPKRGFRHHDRFEMATMNVDLLGQSFEDGATVTTEDLRGRHLVPEFRGGVKVLGRGEIDKKLTVKVQAISPGARAKIEAAGGTVELVTLAGAPIVVEEAPAAKAPKSEATPEAVSDAGGGEDETKE